MGLRPNDLITLNHLCKDPISKYSHVLYHCGVEHQPTHFEGYNSAINIGIS